MPRASPRTAEDWAELLGTGVLNPAEFDGIAISRGYLHNNSSNPST
jgi:hypothetical protein